MTYSSVIHACAKMGDVDKAEHWFKRVTEAELWPNEVTYSTVIHACAKMGDVDKAEHWSQKVLKGRTRSVS